MLHEPSYRVKCPKLWFDNLGATYLNVNFLFHTRIKHLEFNVHFACDKVSKKQLQVIHLSIVDQIADVLTKVLSKNWLNHLNNKLKMFKKNSLT